MPIGICDNNHVTGFRTCPMCQSKKITRLHIGASLHSRDKRVKRAITQRIRQAGEIPVADFRKGIRKLARKEKY